MKVVTILGILGGILSMVAYLPYWLSIFKGTTRPQRASWLIWIFSDILIFTTSASLGATDSLWVPGAYVVGTIITFAISLKRGEGGTHWFDFLCLFVTALSVALWLITGDAFQSLVINLVIVAIGCVPTVIKIRQDPYEEKLTGCVFWALGNTYSLLSIFWSDNFTIDLWIQPVGFLFLQALIALCIVVFRIKKLQ